MLRLKEVSVIAPEGGRILERITLQVQIGQLCILIGNNGAGKSEVLRVISGLLRSTSGTVELQEKTIDKLPPFKIAKAGIGHVPEGRRLFLDQSVEDNLMLGAFTRCFHESKGVIKNDVKMLYSKFPLLERHAKHLAGTLSGGELQILAIGRALMGRPKILMLDEPSLGLAPLMVREIFQIIRDLKGEGLGILLVEQIASYAVRICDYGYVMHQGKIFFEAERRGLMEDPNLVKAYLV